MVVVVLQRVMATRKPLEIPMFLFLHNAALCIGSLGLGVWLTAVLWAQYAGGFSPLELICARGMHDNGHLHVIYYINSAFKFWEFTDTFLLILRKRPVAFLHSYHHAATLVLTYVQMVEHSTAQWVPIVLNLWVHVFMYYYYAMSALGVRVWWKKHLTTIQIAQFVIDVVVIAYAYSVFIRGGWSEDVCYGTSKAAVVGGLILISYLVLFVRFFLQTYSKASAAPKKEL
jgi:fatty acid elongase 3